MKIQMQYPVIKENYLCDGSVHIINPLALRRIENGDLYLLDYFDESYECNCTTILIKTKEGFKKIPLLDYDLLYEMIENDQLDLLPVSIYEITMINRNLFIKTEPPQENISITLARAAIIIYIGKDGNLYTKINGEIQRIDAQQLSAIMEQYDIEWRYLNNNELVSPDAINTIINNYLGYQPGLTVKEKYKYGDIRHYIVSFEYIDSNGFRRGNSSI